MNNEQLSRFMTYLEECIEEYKTENDDFELGKWSAFYDVKHILRLMLGDDIGK